VRKILVVLIVIPIFFWGIWIAIPGSSIQSAIENYSDAENFALKTEGLKKGLFFNFDIDRLTINRSGKEQFSLQNLHCRIKPLPVLLLQLRIYFNGDTGGGTLSGKANLKKNYRKIQFDVKEASINEIPLLKNIGIQGTGTVSGSLVMENDSGYVEFVTSNADFETAVFSGVPVPLQYFHNVRGAAEIKGNVINIVSVALEGNDVYARLKGLVRDRFMDLRMELMPGRSLLENPLFIHALDRYKVSPGYYVIPVKGYITS
jgi:type II secretion system protein N